MSHPPRRQASPTAFVHVSGPNGRELQRFYERAFGRGAVGRLGSGPVVVSGQAGAASSAFLSVADLEKALARVERAGGVVTARVIELPANAGRVAAIRDPAGNELSLWQPAPKARRAGAGAKGRSKRSGR